MLVKVLSSRELGCVFMRKRKHQFHCQRCGLPCEIYRKGKGHRVLICPSCGVLATNPFSFGKSLKGALRGGISSIPVVGGAIAGATEGFTSDKGVGKAPSSIQKIEYVDRYTAQERVQDALGR